MPLFWNRSATIVIIAIIKWSNKSRLINHTIKCLKLNKSNFRKQFLRVSWDLIKKIEKLLQSN